MGKIPQDVVVEEESYYQTGICICQVLGEKNVFSAVVENEKTGAVGGLVWEQELLLNRMDMLVMINC